MKTRLSDPFIAVYWVLNRCFLGHSERKEELIFYGLPLFTRKIIKVAFSLANNFSIDRIVTNSFHCLFVTTQEAIISRRNIWNFRKGRGYNTHTRIRWISYEYGEWTVMYLKFELLRSVQDLFKFVVWGAIIDNRRGDHRADCNMRTPSEGKD